MRTKKKEKRIEEFKSYGSRFVISNFSPRYIIHISASFKIHPLRLHSSSSIFAKILEAKLTIVARNLSGRQRLRPFSPSSFPLYLFLPSFLRARQYSCFQTRSLTAERFSRENWMESLEAVTNLNAFDNPRLIHPNEIKISLYRTSSRSSCPLDPHQEIAIRNRVVEKFE